MMQPAILFRITALLGMLAVCLGAFGAHGLRDILERNGTTHVWEKAVFYQLVHVITMLVLTLNERGSRKRAAWLLFLGGIVLFSGSLYALALTNIRTLGMITPIGGVCFVAGWLCLLIKPPFERQQSGTGGPGSQA